MLSEPPTCFSSPPLKQLYRAATVVVSPPAAIVAVLFGWEWAAGVWSSKWTRPRSLVNQTKPQREPNQL
ncbi:hypothetical protein V6N11_000042 [Hibiscus sabdariffa]|uniref:Uncharacterized protein n=2 Tax=Hibiscus sabdariffa TaxID=183260 RepID=A0ABR2NNF4_9ROSI